MPVQPEQRWTVQVLDRKPGLRYATATLLTYPGGQVWTALRHKAPMIYLYECPGGAIEGEEWALQGAVREVKEETGLDIAHTRFIKRGFIVTNGWAVFLFQVDLKHYEKPQRTEPAKRGEWELRSVGNLYVHNCIPGLSALAAMFFQER